MTGGGNRQQRRRYGRERRISVRAVQRDPVDLTKLSRVLLALAQAEAEATAQAEREATNPPKEPFDGAA
jgi:hypothetical protein